MPTFIEKCNCRGNRPGGIAAMRYNLRPTLTGRLLSDRHCVRYIVAPDGFGKSSLAYEYAQIVFEFQHVFWIRCESPCFMRDLDAENLSRQILACDASPSLVVCDDVPILDTSRIAAFEDFMAEMLDAGCEVMVCCTPSNDALTHAYPDSIQIRAGDLLLSDDEVEIERMRGMEMEDFESNGKQWRIASYAWSEGSNDKIVAGISQERLPLTLKSAILSLLLFGEGSISSLASILPPSTIQADLVLLEQDYPYLGIDFDNDSFDAMEVSVDDIAKAFGSDIAKLKGGFNVAAGDSLVESISDVLSEMGKHSRACEFMLACGKREKRLAWAHKRGWSLAFLPDPLSFMKLVKNGIENGGRSTPEICTIFSWCAYILGDDKSARKYCAKARRLGGIACPLSSAIDLMSLLLDGRDAEYCDSNRRRHSTSKSADMEAGHPASAAMPLDWELACSLERARLEDRERFSSMWLECMEGECSENDGDGLCDTLLFSGALHLKAILESNGGAEDKDADWEFASKVVEYSLDVLDAGEKKGWIAYLSLKMMEACIDRHPYEIASKVEVSDVAAMRKVDLLLFDQAGKWRKMSEGAKRKKAEYELTHPDPYRKNPSKASDLAALRTTTPTLAITLFGGLKCLIGDGSGQHVSISREKAKILLALITLNKGREISREKLVRMLWPESDFDSANKNLYVVWSFLRRTLTIGQSCPYLLRTQNGFSVDERYVTSDLSEYEELCKNLLFEQDDMTMWEEMYEKVSDRFADELVPNILNNQSIDSARKMYRDRLVDGLVAASSRLFLRDEARGAMWYAREAKRRDPAREDVYIALMSAQIASDQRACALDTYFECRRFLSENMGIDPSSKVMDLYRSIIEEEQEF